jgi:hypothetical protein
MASPGTNSGVKSSPVVELNASWEERHDDHAAARLVPQPRNEHAQRDRSRLAMIIS